MVKYGDKKTHLFAWEELYYIDYDIKLIFEAEMQILNHLDNYVNELLNQHRVDEMIANVPPLFGGNNLFYSSFESLKLYRKQQIINTITQSHRKSAILSIYSIVEGQMKLIINLIERVLKFKIRLEDINGRDYLNQAWNYLIKVVEIDHSELDSYFTPLRQHRYIRNKIAHENSKIDNSKIKLINESKGLNAREIDNEHYIYIQNNEFIENLLDASLNFFNKALIAIDNRYAQLNQN